ncbi:MAG: hypothetical protein V4463_05365 [Pseudomonadota bacterium]
MSTNHHQGEITAPTTESGRAFGLIPVGCDTLDDLIDWNRHEFKRAADAKRIKACWNAFNGIATELIEDGRLFATMTASKPYTISAADALAECLFEDGWFNSRADCVETLHERLKVFLDTFAPGGPAAHQRGMLSRTNSAQDASFERHGSNHYARMIEAYGLARQFEIENQILQDMLPVRADTVIASPLDLLPSAPANASTLKLLAGQVAAACKLLDQDHNSAAVAMLQSAVALAEMASGIQPPVLQQQSRMHGSAAKSPAHQDTF